jgi:hypothetical protein
MNSKIKIADKIKINISKIANKIKLKIFKTGVATTKIILAATIPFVITRYLPPEYQVLLTLLMTISLGFYVIYLLIKGFCKLLEKTYSAMVTHPEKKKGGFKRAFYGLAKFLLRFFVVYILFVYSIYTVVSIHVS